MGTYTSKYTGQEIDNGINPVGTIISFMGTIAPEGFLVCDGSEINIAAYGNLATHFETQFGTKNHFGGDGETTFALPDLRNEFLRGYHSGASEQLSGEVGIHQDATEHIIMASATDGSLYYSAPTDTSKNDNFKSTRGATLKIKGTTVAGSPATDLYYTSRPTNVAVLYCIKY